MYEHITKAIEDYGNRVIELYRGHLEDAGYTDGKLYKTISSSVTKEGSTFMVTINLEDYWKYIENGRKAGSKMPPVDVIENWITVKRILPRPMTLSSGKTVIPTVKQLAFLIARSIGEKGISPRPFLDESIENTNEEFKIKFQEAITQDIIEMLR